MARFDEFFEASRNLVAGTSKMRKLNIMLWLYGREDRGLRRKDFAALHRMSPRTVIRWIHQFNADGIPGIFFSSSKRPGRKRKVTRKDFDEQILPAAEQLSEAAGKPVTVKSLFRSAQTLGLFPWSISTFRRRLGTLPVKYRKPRIEPTFDEWMYHATTGRWPARLKSFCRRRQKQEKIALQRFREEYQRSKAAAAQ